MISVALLTASTGVLGEVLIGVTSTFQDRFFISGYIISCYMLYVKRYIAIFASIAKL
jgi:hypothetical protein